MKKMGIVLSDADGTIFPATLGSNAKYTDEMKKNLAKIYEDLVPLSWTANNMDLFKERVFIMHTGREDRFNQITRQSMNRHFGLLHFRIVNVAFAGSHEKYVQNKIQAIIDLIEYWNVNKLNNEVIKVIDDDQEVIKPIFKIYGLVNGIYIYTVINNVFIRIAE